MRIRLTLTLDIGRPREQPPTGDLRETQLDAYVENTGPEPPRRRIEYPFGFTQPEDHE